MAQAKERGAGQASGSGRLRIVGGRFRGRRLPIPDQTGLRPTPDRVRETLFNWLAPLLPGSRCLDLFAGSGALGLEAASRGAGEVVLVERSEPVASQLRSNVLALGAEGILVVRAEALTWLGKDPSPYHVVFLDPPYAAGLLGPACERLAHAGWLAPAARIYLETDARSGFPVLPPDWTLVRDRTAGQVRFGLALAP